MLTEYKNKNHHFYFDEHGRKQGEYKDWWDDGDLREHCFYKDNKKHGEKKWWWNSKTASTHRFFQDGEDITGRVKELVSDINIITDEEKMIIKLKFGIECLC